MYRGSLPLYSRFLDQNNKKGSEIVAKLPVDLCTDTWAILPCMVAIGIVVAVFLKVCSEESLVTL